MKSSRWLIVFLAVLLVAAVGFFVWQNYYSSSNTSTNQPSGPKTGLAKDKVVIATSRAIADKIYPENSADFYSITLNSHIFEPLYTFDFKNQLTPLLATKVDNPDNLTWRFYLSKTAKFSDGTSVTAADVKFSYDYIKSNSLPMKDTLPPVKDVKVVDDHTIEFITDQPNPVLLNQLALNFLVMSKADVTANGTKNHLGSGPYKLASITADQIDLIRNDNYWRAEPKIKNVTFKVMKSETDRVAALLKGDIDYTSYGTVDPTDITTIDAAFKAGKVQKNKSLDSGIGYILLDTVRDKTPGITGPNPLKILKVRQAIYEAIDVNKLGQATESDYAVDSQMVSPGIFGYNSAITRPAYNVTDAKKLMTDAGYPNGFTMRVDYYGAPGGDQPLLPLVAQLALINIKVTLNPINPDTFFDQTLARNTSAYVSSYSADSLDSEEIFNYFFRTPTGDLGQGNLGYSNPTLDTLIDQASSTMNQKTRLPQLQRAMKIVMDDVAVIPFFQYKVSHAYSKDLYWVPRLDNAIRAYEMSGRQAS